MRRLSNPTSATALLYGSTLALSALLTLAVETAATRRSAQRGLVPKRHQSGEVDYAGGISKCGDRRVRTLLYEAANVMLTRYNGQLKLKEWAFAIPRRSSMRKARIRTGGRDAINRLSTLG
jgi:transposase